MREMPHSKEQKNVSFGKLSKYGMGCLTILVCLVVIYLIWGKVVRFPLQIFGTPEDHFRGHVIDPMPPSVKNLKVEFDDLIIHPDVTYWFRFNIELNDLEKIIKFRSLQQVSRASSASYPPSWWNVEDLRNPEIYEYSSESLHIVLWWDVSKKEVYYMFVTF